MLKWIRSIWNRTSDKALACICMGTCAIGLVGIYSIVTTSKLSDCADMSRFYTQLIAALLGIGCMFFLGCLDVQKWVHRFWWVLGLTALGLLAATLLWGKGVGNRSWIRIPFGLIRSFQPSEFVKPLFLLTFSLHLEKIGEKVSQPFHVLLLFLHAGCYIGMVLLQGDLGTALVYVAAALLMCYGAGMHYGYFAALAALGIVAFPFLWERMPEYRRKRILVAFAPQSDPLGYGYQVMLSKNAISSGGWFGKGWRVLEISASIPAAHTDMIFAVICEQTGFLGGGLLLVLYALILLRILMVGAREKNGFTRTFCTGVVGILGSHIAENVAMNLGLAPVVGIPLPFISCGGSALISCFFMIGLVLGIEQSRQSDTKRILPEEKSELEDPDNQTEKSKDAQLISVLLPTE